MAWVLKVFLSAGETKHFFGEDWTTQISLNSLGKSGFTCNRISKPAGSMRAAIAVPDLPVGQINVLRRIGDDRASAQRWNTTSETFTAFGIRPSPKKCVGDFALLTCDHHPLVIGTVP